MGVVKIGEGGEEDLRHVIRIEVGEVLEHALIVFADGLLGLLGGLLVEEVLQQVEFQAAVPEIVGLGAVAGQAALERSSG